MNKDTFQGKWQEIKGSIKEKWGKLTNDDITMINGRREELLGSLQKRYGYAKEKAEQELASFEKSCGCSHDKNMDAHSHDRNEGHSSHENMNDKGNLAKSGKHQHRSDES